jgi:hypothetical protein
MGGYIMSQETLATAASIGTFIVIAATAVAAVVQLRHLRAQNQLTGLLTVLARVEDPQFNEWVDNARQVVADRLPDPAYRRAILDGTFDRKNNAWLNLANSYDWVGSLVKHNLIPEESLLDVYSFRVTQAWEIVEGIVPLVRSRSGPVVWENFEYLVVRAREWNAQHAEGAYPKGVPRLRIDVTWPELAETAVS